MLYFSYYDVLRRSVDLNENQEVLRLAKRRSNVGDGWHRSWLRFGVRPAGQTDVKANDFW